MAKRLSLILAAAFVIAIVFAATGFAQSDPRGRSHTLRGTVEGINGFAQSIRVSQDKIEGFSEARIETYNVDDTELLTKLEVGDQIVATIFEKDDTLYDIRVVRIYDSRPFPYR